MTEPPVVHAIENQKSRDDIAADMSPTIPGFPTPPTSQPDRKMTVQLQSQQVDHSQAAAAVEGQEVMLGVFDAQKVASVRTAVDADGPAGKRKRVLRAASDLAPGSCVDTESLRSPIASFDGGSQQGDICMKEPPVVHAIENQKSRDDIAADMSPTIPGFPTPPTSQPDRKMTVQLQSQQVDHSQAAAAVEGQEVMLGVFDAQKVASVRTAVDADGPAGKRKRVLRAASDLAPGSCVDTESLSCPIASFDGGSQQGGICMKEPPVVHAIENQKSRDDIAANMRPSGTADPPAMERPASEQNCQNHVWIKQRRNVGLGLKTVFRSRLLSRGPIAQQRRNSRLRRLRSRRTLVPRSKGTPKMQWTHRSPRSSWCQLNLLNLQVSLPVKA